MIWIEIEHLVILISLLIVSLAFTIYGYFNFHPAIFVCTIISDLIFAWGIVNEVEYITSDEDHEE